VLAGEVTGTPIDDIDSVSLPEIRGKAALVARGRVDIDNDGESDNVGIIEYSEDSGAGCGVGYHPRQTGYRQIACGLCSSTMWQARCR
jgi:hypothetical protein